jgi:hypothetical protein
MDLRVTHKKSKTITIVQIFSFLDGKAIIYYPHKIILPASCVDGGAILWQ